MRVLIACERSGTVRRAFRERGHDAWSCDLFPAVDGGEHILCDNDLHILDILKSWNGMAWDFVLGHPPCTRLANSGSLRLYKAGKKANGWDESMRADMYAAACFFRAILFAPAKRVAIENPILHCHARALIGVNYTQTIQPWQFGHAESKRTCLWLRNLPRLTPTEILKKPPCGYWDNQTPSGQNKLGPSPDRGYKRAVTYIGIAKAMAEQWGNL